MSKRFFGDWQGRGLFFSANTFVKKQSPLAEAMRKFYIEREMLCCSLGKRKANWQDGQKRGEKEGKKKPIGMRS